MIGVYIILFAVAAAMVCEGLVIVGFLFAAAAADQDPATVDLEEA